MIPSEDYKSSFEDVPVAELWPFLSSTFRSLFGGPIDGRKFSLFDWKWIPVKNRTRFEKFFDGLRDSKFVKSVRGFDQFVKNLNSLKYYPFRRHY